MADSAGVEKKKFFNDPRKCGLARYFEKKLFSSTYDMVLENPATREAAIEKLGEVRPNTEATPSPPAALGTGENWRMRCKMTSVRRSAPIDDDFEGEPLCCALCQHEGCYLTFRRRELREKKRQVAAPLSLPSQLVEKDKMIRQLTEEAAKKDKMIQQLTEEADKKDNVTQQMRGILPA